MIRITNKTGLGKHTEVYNENGTRVHGVQSIKLDEIDKDSVVTATIDFIQPEFDIEAEPLLSLESLERFAKHYGYKLVEVNNE